MPAYGAMPASVEESEWGTAAWDWERRGSPFPTSRGWEIQGRMVPRACTCQIIEAVEATGVYKTNVA